MVRVRIFIGIICIAISIWMFLSGELSENPAPAIVGTPAPTVEDLNPLPIRNYD